jgi:hypothetical protein
MRSLLIPLIALAWLGCGYWGVRRMVIDLAKRQPRPIESWGDVISVLCNVAIGPIALLISFVVVPSPARDFKRLNRLFGVKAILICLSAGLLGCGDIPRYETDQALRRTIFMECLKAVPPGPQSTKYNDWDEVISECSSVAYYQAQVCVSGCGEAYNKGEK